MNLKNNPQLLRILVSLVLIVTGILFLAFQVAIPGFGVGLKVKKTTYFANFTILIVIAMLMVGVYLLFGTLQSIREPTEEPAGAIRELTPEMLSKDGDQQSNRRFESMNLPTSRVIISIIMIVHAIIHLFIFGATFTEFNPRGNWLVLGGPALFFPLSAIPLLVGMGLLLYVGYSGTRTALDVRGNHLVINEQRIITKRTKSVQVDLNQVNATRMTDKPPVWRLGWWILLGIHAWYCLAMGIHLLSDPNVFGMGVWDGLVFLITGIIQLAITLVLSLSRELTVSLHSSGTVVEFTLKPWRGLQGSQAREFLAEILNLPTPEEEVLVPSTHTPLEVLQRVIPAVFLITMGVLAEFFQFYMASYGRYIFIIGGAILLCQYLRVQAGQVRLTRTTFDRTKSWTQDRATWVNSQSADPPSISGNSLPWTVTIVFIIPLVLGLHLPGLVYFIANIPTGATMLGIHVLLDALVVAIVIWYGSFHECSIMPPTGWPELRLSGFACTSQFSENKPTKIPSSVLETPWKVASLLGVLGYLIGLMIGIGLVL